MPVGALSNKHSAATFKPYDPAKALGDLSPTTPKPAKNRNNCGVFGAILLVVIAVAVAVVTSGAAIAALSPAVGSIGAGIGALAAGQVTLGAAVAAGAIGGAVGSIASQGIGVATGLQDKFSWKNVGMAALSGGISGGMGASGIFDVGSKFAQGAMSAAASNALSQGIGVATGLQDKFDWAGVAAAGIGGGVGASLGRNLQPLSGSGLNLANGVAHMAVSGVSAMANAAARTLLNGSDFGDNIAAALPDVIGSTIGNMIAGAAQGSGSRGTASGRPTLAYDPSVFDLDPGQDVFVQGSAARRGETDEQYEARQAAIAAQYEAQYAAQDAAAAASNSMAQSPVTVQAFGSIAGGAPSTRFFDWMVGNYGNNDVPGFLNLNRDEYGLRTPADYAALAQGVIADSEATGEFHRLERLVLPMAGNFAADPQYGNNWAAFRDGIKAHVDARNAFADRQTFDIVNTVAPTQFLTGAYRWYNGEHNIGNAIAIASPLAAPLLSLGGRFISRFGSRSGALDEMGSFTATGADVFHAPGMTRIGGDELTLRVGVNARRLDGFHDVVAHGVPYDEAGAIFRIDGLPTNANQIADAVRANSGWTGQPVRLLTCYGGCGPAQELSNVLGVPVRGATGPVGVARVPNSVPTVRNGGWFDFFPQ